MTYRYGRFLADLIRQIVNCLLDKFFDVSGSVLPTVRAGKVPNSHAVDSITEALIH
jgi:hypothetical protein